MRNDYVKLVEDCNKHELNEEDMLIDEIVAEASGKGLVHDVKSQVNEKIVELLYKFKDEVIEIFQKENILQKLSVKLKLTKFEDIVKNFFKSKKFRGLVVDKVSPIKTLDSEFSKLEQDYGTGLINLIPSI